VTVVGSAPTAAAGPEELESARLLLARLGVSPADLLGPAAPRREVPTFAGYVPVNAESVDGLDRSGDLVHGGCQGVKRPAKAVVVEAVRVDGEHFFHRPVTCPLVEADHGFRAGQTVGDKGLDDLPVGGVGSLADRTGLLDDARAAQASAEVRDHR
jgi:hypothetical protein